MDIKYIKYLSGIITESEWLNEEEDKKHYMFFANLKTIQDAIQEILKMNQTEIDNRISNGHDWANDHIAVAKDNIEQVFHWLKSRE
jgi:hypothetical protein